jgi:predicted DNA-binding protein
MRRQGGFNHRTRRRKIMPNNLKTEVLRFRLSPELKEKIQEIAKAERRSMSNLLELAIIHYIKHYEANKK